MKEKLPDIWWITPDITSVDACSMLLSLLKQRQKEGISHIQFRQTLLSEKEYRLVYNTIAEVACHHSLTLIINGEPKLANALHAQGCYLDAAHLLQYRLRPLPAEYWVGAYCHNSEELSHAEKIGLDFVSLSPVKPTKTHPHQMPLGWDRFQSLSAHVSLPVYALGGMHFSDTEEAQKRGGKGIMGIRLYSS